MLTDTIRRGLYAATTGLFLSLGLVTAHADPIEIIDIAGRKVTVNAPIERVILGEGRQIYLVAALDRDDPFKRIVSWRDDFPKADRLTYRLYAEKFPKASRLPTFGGMKEGSFDVEQAVALKPDVLFMNIESKVAADEARLVEKLQGAGIPVVYIDFRERPFENTDASMRIFGKLFGKEKVAEDFIAFRNAEIARVTDRLKAAKPKAPVVLMERAAGYSEECCMTFGKENFGLMVEMAGGKNLAADLLPGTFGVVNPEQIITANPEVVIMTGAQWDAYVPGGAWIGLGPGADLGTAGKRLAALMKRPAFTGIAAGTTQRAHGIWHQFYNSPYQFVAIQQIAKWLHPDLFKDLDPEKTFIALHETFLPIPYKPGYWVSMEAAR